MAELAITPARRKALEIVSAGLEAIDTKAVINSTVRLDSGFLTIKNEKINLKKFKRIFVIGFGKASATAAFAIEKIFGEKIFAGAVIDQSVFGLKRIHGYKGTHPRPSPKNLEASKSIIDLARGISADDLVIMIISGGGSSMLCWPEEELNQSSRLYDEFLKTGGNIEELNTIRKHLSLVKGGGLAKIFYPAKIIGLIFCDIPGGKSDKVASGPMYKDDSTIADAESILKKYGLKGFYLNETPKEDIYFKNVTNIPLVTNLIALNAMAEKGKELGLIPKIISSNVYESARETISKMRASAEDRSLILAGGEIQLAVKKTDGKGGRNQYIAIDAVGQIKDNDVFVSIASDGMDNSDAAGAIVDELTAKKARELGLDQEDYIERYDTYNFFLKTGGLIFTGPTGANVADLMLLLKE